MAFRRSAANFLAPYQIPNLARFALSSLVNKPLLPALVIPQPSVKRGRCDECDEFFDRPADCLAEFDESLTLLGLRMNLPLDPTPEDLVLFLQKLNVLGKFAVSAGRDQGQ